MTGSDPGGGAARAGGRRLGRRALLAAVASGTVAGVAGCAGLAAPRADPGDAEAATNAGRRTGPSDGNRTFAQTGLPATICEEGIRDDPGIYAVVDPAFDADWSAYDVPDLYGGLTDDAVVVGVAVGGEARAYPLPVLWYHEIVNDVVGGSPVMVTYCPLCRSGLVASRVVEGAPTEFLVSGLLWQPERLRVAIAEANGTVFGADRDETDARVRQSGNLVMYDRATRSYWSQIAGRAICGPLNGTRLSILPSTVATWGEWRRARAEPMVLLPPPYSGTTDPDGRRGGAEGGR